MKAYLISVLRNQPFLCGSGSNYQFEMDLDSDVGPDLTVYSSQHQIYLTDMSLVLVLAPYFRTILRWHV
jgi:hypothetical protein